MLYDEALDYVLSRNKFGIKFGLDNIHTLLKRLDCPYKKLKCVHITGTNGKGSVASMVSSILTQAGYKVGLYTSPHLVDIRERVQVARKWILKSEFAKDMTVIKEIIENDKSFEPTFFEVLTAIALNHFVRSQVDFVVLEVGMGGRLDATNVVDAMVSVITNISLEHTDFLGSDKKEIAAEKAAIIKDRNFVITGETDRDVLALILRKCRETKSKLMSVGREITFSYVDDGDINYQTASYVGKIQSYENVKIPLLGKHQIVNAAIVLGVVEALMMKGVDISEKAIRDGFRKAEWRGRFQVVHKQKTNYILDCAHNIGSMKYLVDTIKTYFPDRKFPFIITFAKDKAVSEMLDIVAPLVKEFIFPNMPENSRMSNNEDLVAMCKQKNIDVLTTCTDTVAEAVKYTKNREFVFCAGSVFLVGEALPIVDAKNWA